MVVRVQHCMRGTENCGENGQYQGHTCLVCDAQLCMCRISSSDAMGSWKATSYPDLLGLESASPKRD